jgi:hypothetical protein
MGFSRSARLRLLKEVATIDWRNAGKCLFLTLTYPDEIGPCTYKERTTQRTLVMRRIEKYLGRKVATLWRIEWQDRKSGSRKGELMPHLHILLFGVDYLPWADLRQWWRECLGYGGTLHTFVQLIDGAEGTAKYAAKYAAKDCSSSLVNAAYLDRLSGRSWGFTRKGQVPKHEKRVFRDLTEVQERQLRATGKLLTHNPTEGEIGSYTLLGEVGRQVARLLLDSSLTVDTFAPTI